MAQPTTATTRRSTRNLKREVGDTSGPPAAQTPSKSRKIKQEPITPPSTAPRKARPVKSETSPSPLKTKSSDKAANLQSKKLAAYASYAQKSPFPNFKHPTPDECRLAHSILADLHGDRTRPTTIVAPTNSAGCGNSPSVLDALVRTILSQNTSDRNSSRAKRCMDDAYGASDKWSAVVEGGQPKLQKTIESGGLSVVKSKVIIDILNQVHEKYGEYSLDHLFDEPDDAECMREMLAFKGIGPKTASCVLLFCLQRQSFAVDTHVHRVTGLLGWRPQGASREECHAHLDATIPDEEKYPLHILLIAHGKKCLECKAGGKNAGKCALRKAFRKGVKHEIKDENEETGEENGDIKEEEE